MALAVLAATSSASAQTYRLNWDANSDPYTAGYRVFGGERPGQYGWSVDVGNATDAILPTLTPGTAYYFTVRAYNASGEMGPPSSEVSFTPSALPGAPRTVSATTSGSTATVSWMAPAGGSPATNYLISVGTAPGASDVLAGVSVGNVLSVSGSLPQYRYYARVYAVNAYGVGPASSEVTFSVGGGDQPGNPSGLSVSWNGTVATLSWNPSAGASTHYLEAGTAPGAADFARIDVGAVTRYVVDVPAGTYYVRVRGASAAAVSGPSNEIVVQGPGAPQPPTNLSATGTKGVVDLRWFASTAGPQPLGYFLEAGSRPGAADVGTLQIGPQTRFVTTAPPGVYYVRVRALNARGASSPSNEIIVRR